MDYLDISTVELMRADASTSPQIDHNITFNFDLD